MTSKNPYTERNDRYGEIGRAGFYRLFCFIAMAGIFCSLPAFAAVPDKLKSVEQTLAEQQKQEQSLARKVSEAKTGLKATQGELVKLAASIQENEQRMAGLDERIAAMEAEEKDLTARLESDYGSISDLILALERIRRIPPEAMIARPGAPLQTAQSAMLMQGILPGVTARAGDLAASLDHLQDIKTALAAEREQAEQTGAKLKEQYADLKDLAEKRKTQFQSSQSDYKEIQSAVSRISKEAQNLRDLVARLEKQEREAAARKPEKKTAQVLPRAGTAGLPVAGTVITGFGGKDDIGAVSQGIRVKTRSGALAVAPMGGIVKFAGAFRQYGQMVIIEHEGNYHSLVGGLGKISVAVGQSIKSGEPIGNMPDGASSNESATLYYELRRNGRPVDPASKLKSLRS